MNWEETLIKSQDINWKHRMKKIRDGKLDFDLHLPLDDLFRIQAKESFAQGMMAMFQFHIKHQKEKKVVEREDVVVLFNECGLPEIAEQIK